MLDGGEELEGYVGATHPPDRPNAALPWAPAPRTGPLQGPLPGGASRPPRQPHLAATQEGQLLAIWSIAASGTDRRVGAEGLAPPGREREAGPESPLDDFGPLWMEALLGML